MHADAKAADAPDESGFIPFQGLIAAHAAARPGAIAFREGDHTITWKLLLEHLTAVAHALRAMGVAPLDRVAVLGAASIPYIECIFGIVAARGCVVPLPVSASTDTLSAMLADSGAKVLILDPGAGPEIEAMAARLEDEGSLKVIRFAPDGDDGGDFAAWRTEGEALADASAPGHVPLEPSRPEDPFNIIYSSGTTGVPKGIVHLHGMRQRQANRGGLGFGPDTVTLLSTPMYSNTTIIPTLGTVASGGQTVLMRKFDAGRFIALAASHHATHVMLVPVQYKRILDHADFDRSDLSSFVLSQSTGAPMSVALKQEIIDRWPGRFLELFGMTEGGIACFLEAKEHPTRLATVGRAAAGAALFLIDESGRRLPMPQRGAGQDAPVGEVVGRTPFMMAGYHGRPEANAAIRWYDEEGRMHHRTGDIGRFDEDGFLTLLDRSKDVIISGGNNIYAADLEAVAARHPDVQDVAVIGVPSDQWGESPMALVVVKSGSGLDAVALRDWVNGQVGKTQRLVAVELRDELPRSHLGKLSKKELRAPYWKGGERRIG